MPKLRLDMPPFCQNFVLFAVFVVIPDPLSGSVNADLFFFLFPDNTFSFYARDTQNQNPHHAIQGVTSNFSGGVEVRK